MKKSPFLYCGLVAFSFILLSGCGGGNKKKTELPTRQFPSVQVPSVIADLDRLDYALDNFWDAFTTNASLYRCDSLYIGGVKKEDVESQVGMFATLLIGRTPEKTREAVAKAFEKFESCERADTSTNVLEGLNELMTKYLYDPNSPVRNEDAYGQYAHCLSESEFTPEGLRGAYAFDEKMCSLNATDKPAADFTLTEKNGRRRTLYSVKSPLTLLFFSNPGCPECARIIETLSGSPLIVELIDNDILSVVNIYIDPDHEAWMDYVDTYPKNWICGYDPEGIIRSEILYNVRAIPSLYLLDNEKRVILKDATLERVMDTIERAVS